ncbi:unnamed protein product [Cylicocyclus nassatus]|uniref:G protein-coupled receptor n=1 Tax=Cylicocyclus nassatus TaxID=53992 RepID=A0AA36GJV5_CYLNA|nr:unnamed protein product [Cylicocyclus nassatus]
MSYFRHDSVGQSIPSMRMLCDSYIAVDVPLCDDIGYHQSYQDTTENDRSAHCTYPLTNSRQHDRKLLMFLTMDVGSYAEERLRQTINFEEASECVAANLDFYEWKILLVAVHMYVMVFPAYAIIQVLRWKTIARLKSDVMSEKTRRMQSQLLKAITYQSCLPLFLATGMISWMVGNAVSPNFPLLQFMYNTVGLAPILSPLLSLYYIKPYRDWLSQKMPCESRTHSSTKDVTKQQQLSSVVS